MSKVLVLKGDSYKAVGAIFEEKGYEVAYDSSSLSGIDLVVFTGGSDVSPYIYGEEPNGARGCDPVRDEFEKSMYEMAQQYGIPCVGICRGGQLLNVLNGGMMIQDLDFQYSGLESMGPGHYPVHVDHHQGIVAGEKATDVIGYMSTLGHNDQHDSLVVSCWYPETKSLCFQPHPEWGHEPTKQYFFNLIDKYIGGHDVE